MKLLLVSDQESPYYWDYYTPGRLDGIDLILSCGDLKADYLSFLVTMGRAPVLYVRGNHDRTYATHPPEGCDCIENQLVTVKGLRILGLGGCPRYNLGTDQYTEKEMARRIRRCTRQIKRAGGVDIVLTHAAPRGFGDGPDPAHMGFEAFLPLLDQWHPRYLIHGHYHLSYNGRQPRILERNGTTLINAYERYILEIDETV